MKPSFITSRPPNGLVGGGVLRELDPRLKLGAALLFIAVLSSRAAADWTSYYAAAVLTGCVLLLGRVPASTILRRTLFTLPVVVVVACSVLFATPSDAASPVGFTGVHLGFTHAGAVKAASIAVKCWLAVLISTALTATTGFDRLIAAMRSFRVPEVITNTIALMYRYLFVLGSEAGRMMTARDSRSVGSGRSLLWRAKTTGAMVGTLFLRSLSRSERIFAAMQCRGLGGPERHLDAPRWRRADTLSALAWGIGLAIVISLRWVVG